MQNRRLIATGLLSAFATLAGSGASADVRLRLRWYRQVSRSMLPTLEPRTLVQGILGPIVLDPVGAPSSSRPTAAPINVVRGDLVPFHPPGWPDETWIFRVIGFPGERIEISDRVISINDVPVPTEDAGRAPSDPSYYVDNPAPGYRAEADTARLVRETLPNGATFLTLRLNSNSDPRATNMRSLTVPPGRLFLLGDSRDNANDSRFGYLGTLPSEAVLGKIVLL